MRETVTAAVAGLRGKLGDRVARLIDFRIGLATGHRLAEHDRRLAEHQHRLDDHGHRIDDHGRRLDHVQPLQEWTANELERIIPQVASFEARLAAIDDLLSGTPTADDAQVAQARSLIDEIRREHAQIRVRLTGVAQYEERLGRLEERAGQSS
ncbi:hypothetical protein ACFQV2_39710 [Actinokineospora soli]|uniref:Uncharacterized protein n=1 Tax=Actinokineospora soli TaxID=1048753 RepID=A0ABW2TXB7_9PSEU